MIYHQFVTIRTLLNKTCYGFQQILATWCGAYIGVILYKQMCTHHGPPFLLPYLGYKMKYELTFHICDM